jgi:hypothetical protein
MTIPAIFFGVLVSTCIGAGFHLIKGGSLGRLFLYILLAWIGFWVGHLIGEFLNWTFLSIGPLHFGTALVGCFLFLLVGYWLSLIRQPS